MTYTYIQMIYISVDHPFSDQLLSLPTCHFWSTSRWTSSWKSESVDLWRCGTPASRYQRRRLGGKKVYDGMMKHSALVNISEYYWILVNVDMTMIYSLSTDKYRIQWLSSLSQFLPTQLWKSHDILVNHLVKNQLNSACGHHSFVGALGILGLAEQRSSWLPDVVLKEVKLFLVVSFQDVKDRWETNLIQVDQIWINDQL